MTKAIDIKCDGCGASLNYTKYMREDRLLLTTEPRSPDPECNGILYAQSRRISLCGDKHFCGFDCLHKWISEK